MPVPVRAGTSHLHWCVVDHPGTIFTMSTTKNQPTQLAFSANNSKVKCPNGQTLNIHIDKALIELYANNPNLNLIELSERFEYLLEQLTENLPADFGFSNYKQINRLLKGMSAFFFSLTSQPDVEAKTP